MTITNLKQLGTFDMPNGNKIVVDLDDVNGRPMISVRQWYDAGGGDFRPGRQGIAMTPEQWEEVRKLAPAKADIPKPQPQAQNGQGGRKL